MGKRSVLIATILIITSFAITLNAQSSLKQEGNKYLASQNWDLANQSFLKLIESNNADSSDYFNLAFSYQKLKKHDLALKYYEIAKQKNFNAMRVDFNRAKNLAYLRNTEQAISIINTLADQGLPAYSQFLTDPELDPLRSHTKFESIKAKVKENTFPCLTNPLNKKMDFWIGEWDVLVNGTKVGQNSISKAEGGCVIHESYTTSPGAFSGQSMNYYDPEDSLWKQNWVGTTLNNVTKFIETKSSEGLMVFEDDFVNAQGNRVWIRMTFSYNKEKDTVTQHIENSTDDKKSWTTAFNGLYVRRNE